MSRAQGGKPSSRNLPTTVPFAAQILPLTPSSFMHFIGGIEVLVGLVILAGHTRLGPYVATIWLVGSEGCISE
jgi:hypothetical protein